VGGIVTDSAGNVYVADAGSGRVLKFDPFPVQVAPPVSNDENAETTPEVESTVELDVAG
jgi:hypothetical protein